MLKSIYEKELMAMCLEIQKLKHYLVGRHFIVQNDQQSFRQVILQHDINMEYQKWVRKLLGFDFEVQYKLGASDHGADALS